jgi:hypothetical protein
VKIAPDPHRSRLWIGKKRPAQPGMMAGEPLGHQKFHRLAEKLRLPMSKKPFRLGVDQDDLAALLGHHDGVGGRFDG